jgi:hypothetical protein
MTQPTPRTIKPEEDVATILGGALGLDWDLVKPLPTGERVRVPYRMQVLTSAENVAALKAAQETAKTVGELGDYGEIYKEAQAHEVLLRAMRHREPRERADNTSYHPPIFVDGSQLRESLNEMDMAALLNAYEITKRHFSIIEGLEEHDTESWIARLSDPLKGFFHLSQLDSRHWPSLVWLLANTCRDLLQELGRELPSLQPSTDSAPATSEASTGSSGEPPSASTTASPETTVLGDKQLTREEAEEIARKRREGK